MIKKIGVLTSGGDAPGMNAAIRAITRTAITNHIEIVGINDGYRGIIDRLFTPLTKQSVSQILDRGGTFLGSSRYPEFADKATQIAATEILKEEGIEALITIGGDGTYHGALALSELGFPCVALPGTIDNDIGSTEYTIGFDTAVMNAVDAIDKIRDTSNSHRRCMVVEVMGRYCGDIALASGIATGAERIITSKEDFNIEEIVAETLDDRYQGKRYIIYIITENITNVNDLAEIIEERTGVETNAAVLGYIQRGGKPSHNDRLLATELGYHAVIGLINGIKNVSYGSFNGEVKAIPLKEALAMKKNIFSRYKKIIKVVS